MQIVNISITRDMVSHIRGRYNCIIGVICEQHTVKKIQITDGVQPCKSYYLCAQCTLHMHLSQYRKSVLFRQPA